MSKSVCVSWRPISWSPWKAGVWRGSELLSGLTRANAALSRAALRVGGSCAHPCAPTGRIGLAWARSGESRRRPAQHPHAASTHSRVDSAIAARARESRVGRSSAGSSGAARLHRTAPPTRARGVQLGPTQTTSPRGPDGLMRPARGACAHTWPRAVSTPRRARRVRGPGEHTGVARRAACGGAGCVRATHSHAGRAGCGVPRWRGAAAHTEGG
eukprot:1465596-Prymnesium_polylepis.1